MKKYLLLFAFILFLCIFNNIELKAKADSTTINIVRMFSKDIFETNGTPYLKPMVQSMNATSNSRFFNSAYVPKKVKKPYFKVSLNGMIGFVPQSYKTYSPSLPLEPFDFNKLGQFIEPTLENPFHIKDTAGLAYYAFKTVIDNAVKKGYVSLPKSSTTILGNQNTSIYLPHDALIKSLNENQAFQLLPPNLQDTLQKYINQFPENFDLPTGLNMNTFFVGIPQVEIGSLYGTEALIRFIPPINMGENIGDFAFWGLGLKHSISQYFTKYKRYAELSIDEYDSLRSLEETPLDLAVQIVYQGTYMKNKIGVTNAELEANANMFNFNLQLSKKFNKFFEIYGGYSLESIHINADYKYVIPWDLQIKLGLVTEKLDDKGNVVIDPATNWPIYETRPPDYPGDLYPQTSIVKLNDLNHKIILGANFIINKFNIYLDFNYSKFSIFTGGVSYRF